MLVEVEELDEEGAVDELVTMEVLLWVLGVTRRKYPATATIRTIIIIIATRAMVLIPGFLSQDFT